MLIEKIGTFILFLGPLVFFHELGHFFFARYFGVRVEVFSLGFGPKILKKKFKDTEYAISLIPLGGYVKMFGDDPFLKDEIPKDQQAYSFTHKGKNARFWIVMGGPLANIIMAFAIFYGLLLNGEKIPEIKLGIYPKESILSNIGILPGDQLLKINQLEINSPSDLMGDGKNEVKEITVLRKNKRIILNTVINSEKFFEEMMKYPALLRKPFLVNSIGEKFVLSFEQNKVDLNLSLEEMGTYYQPKNIYIYPIKKNQNIENDSIEIDFSKGLTFESNFTNLDTMLAQIDQNGFKTLDLVVRSINLKSPAEKSGIKEGDIFVSIEGQKVFSFESLRSMLQTIQKNKINVEILSEGKLKKFDITPDIVTQDGKSMKLLGVYSFIETQKIKYIDIPSKGVIGSIYFSILRTGDAIYKTLDGFYKLITNKVSFKSIGGPLSIGKVAHDSFNNSLATFFQLMALISVNLGVVNLFPIPVLDGGHIVFILFELVNGGPLSRRKMEIAQQLGFSVLLILMFGAIFNDVSRFF